MIELWKVQKSIPSYGSEGKTTRIKYEILGQGLTFQEADKIKSDLEKKHEDEIINGKMKLSCLRDFSAERHEMKSMTGSAIDAKPKSKKPASAKKLESDEASS